MIIISDDELVDDELVEEPANQQPVLWRPFDDPPGLEIEPVSDEEGDAPFHAPSPPVATCDARNARELPYVPLRCLRCYSKFHMSYECTNPPARYRLCFNCEAQGHLMRECPHPARYRPRSQMSLGRGGRARFVQPVRPAAVAPVPAPSPVVFPSPAMFLAVPPVVVPPWAYGVPQWTPPTRPRPRYDPVTGLYYPGNLFYFLLCLKEDNLHEIAVRAVSFRESNFVSEPKFYVLLPCLVPFNQPVQILPILFQFLASKILKFGGRKGEVRP